MILLCVIYLVTSALNFLICFVIVFTWGLIVKQSIQALCLNRIYIIKYLLQSSPKPDPKLISDVLIGVQSTMVQIWLICMLQYSYISVTYMFLYMYLYRCTYMGLLPVVGEVHFIDAGLTGEILHLDRSVSL